MASHGNSIKMSEEEKTQQTAAQTLRVIDVVGWTVQSTDNQQTRALTETDQSTHAWSVVDEQSAALGWLSRLSDKF
ncbi:hypothetical protein J8273_6370 [Carpediemonas membranifera]|uniref:Uncharacterized protein n=1 Tax=Carpediemonas membranifera TaxID=201153 RepID=A0A8J6AU44_9EUKA|nr:hypothetical protein J8273_6370 [Carpediemonas membranifera]|eukprot:KAG9391605.1 hypothetical protein J8273_6370 [Carpediemonas membranifera]